MTETTGFTKHLVVVVICATIAFGWLAAILVEGGWVANVTGSGYQVHVLMPTAATLTQGDRVTMAGIQVGQVTGVVRQGYDVRVDVELSDNRVYPLPVDSTAMIRQHTPVGENYLSITRGNSTTMMPSGGTIPLSQVGQYVDVDQVLSVLHGQTRQRARQIFESLGSALNGRGRQLNTVVGQGSDAIDNLSQIVNQVLYPDRDNIGQLVTQLGDVGAAIGSRDQAITTIANQALVGLGALRARDSSLTATLDTLPTTLTQLHGLAGTLRSVSSRATPVINQLAGAVTALHPAVNDLPDAASQGRLALRALSAASPALQGTLTQATKLSPPLSAALPTVRTTLCQLNPMLKYFSGDPQDLLSILIGLGSASNSYDETGHLIRLFPIVGDGSGAGLPDSVEKADQTLIHAGILGNSTAFSYQAFGPRNQVGIDHAVSGGPIGPAAEGASGYAYPHVVAGDC